eukprot:Skav221360  [mRNA]  locus=scaffold2286:35159:37935:+ [translate_table: standard]
MGSRILNARSWFRCSSPLGWRCLGTLPKAVALVDPVWTGPLPELIKDRQRQVVAVWSGDCAPQRDGNHNFPFQLQHTGGLSKEALSRTSSVLSKLPVDVQDVMCGRESGVMLTHALSSHMGLRVSGCHLARNKYLQSEALRQRGIRAVRQALAKSEQEVTDFIAQICPSLVEVVIKPNEGAFGLDVQLCLSCEDAVEHFHRIFSHSNAFGQPTEAVLVQERLTGQEYSVNFISRDGIHKCVAIWEYDKKPANGGFVVHFGQWPVSDSDPCALGLAEYSISVLDALHIKNGATNLQIMVSSDGKPCLVECNCRLKGNSSQYEPLMHELVGYSPVNALMDAFFDEAAFKQLPAIPSNFKQFGVMGHIVSRQEGVFVKAPGLQALEQLPSHMKSCVSAQPGVRVQKTTNLKSCAGRFVLLHESRDRVSKDYDHAHELISSEGFFEVIPLNDAVVVVDPISTGALLAAELAQRGLATLSLWSGDCKPEAKASSHTMQLQHAGGLDVDSLSRTANILKASPFEVKGLLPGADPGVLLTHTLANHIGLKPSGPPITLARNKYRQSETIRNKSRQSETIRSCGLRAVKQAMARTEAELLQFLQSFQGSGHGAESTSFKPVIVKPVESRGSRGVKLCVSQALAVEHFHDIISQEFNIFGNPHEGVLVQEYLEGTEYIVDFVSNNGAHKCVGIWEYDKRVANGSSFVYFGQWPMSGSSERAKSLIAYVSQILDVLGILHGATHAEVISDGSGTCDSLCLVEVNCRLNGAGGLWVPLIEKLQGYSQLSALIDAFFDSDAFDQLPQAPPPFSRAGVMGHIPSYKEGILLAAPGLQCLRKLPSCHEADILVHPGQQMQRTIDLNTSAGYFLLLNEDPFVLKQDYMDAHELVAQEDFFTVK